MKPLLIMTVGIPGSGKSSWVRKQFLTDREISNLVYISPDCIRIELSSNISDQSNNIEVWAVAKKRVVEGLTKGCTVILDATNVNTAYRHIFLEGLPPCRLQAKVFHANPEECWQRIQNDLEKKIIRADVPKEVIDRMYIDYLHTVRVLKTEGFQLIEEI